MNCWKTFNIGKDFGTIRLNVLSLMGMIIFFIVYYLLFIDLTHVERLSSFNPIIFLITIIFILPVHKLIHCLSARVVGKKATLSFGWFNYEIIPSIHCNIPGTLSKRRSLLVIASPAVVITLGMVILTIVYPQHLHYFSLISAINFGISISDFVYLNNLIKAPANAFIEDGPDGCRILVKQS
ncbi:putative flippase GtrA [Scopulibacillus daqui]|uniref:Flippase GtrA n=1 Tax=Scopulibacillus daqui TaxID=1469162 RepID=A0ABS2PUS8_9BACL|nr:DUF3267 domain-containing protein [Scopulibacillus daqui]MBM7643813.1 putative flippase GtrA [Scopulibacillus daqui]